MDYEEFFERATGYPPLLYQKRFRDCRRDLNILGIPTGLGKTNTVLVDWLYRLTPRRLIWCLPGRALTDQLFKVASDTVRNLGLEGKVRVCKLMGGSKDNDLTVGPDEHAIFVGTQDILISRALNRGYARSPFRWPIDFALLNNDCYWVFDEVQLLGDALATSTQLAAFRQQFGCFGPAQSCWMSATLDRIWLNTVDFRSVADHVVVVGLRKNDEVDEIVKKRLRAPKRLERAPMECRTPTGAADFVIEHHRPGTRSLVVANTVARARDIWNALKKRSKLEPVLLHSRFRAPDRAAHMQELTDRRRGEDQIVVSTQVIEAGIDISASLLLTDVAPYNSLVQRFGRVNRTGEDSESEIFWVDRPLTERRKAWAQAAELKPKEVEEISAPYDSLEIAESIKTIRTLTTAAPEDLPPVKKLAPWQHVLRRADILDLFDTTPDLAGNEIDISRFVRSGEDKDLYAAWRHWENSSAPPPATLPEITEEELCPAPLGEARDFIKKHHCWTWSPLRGEWERLKESKLYPGLTVVVHSSEGGSTPESGWWPESDARVSPLGAGGQAGEPLDDDRRTYATYPQSLSDHTDDVCEELIRLIDSLALVELESHRGDLGTASRKHDWGKAHRVMQQTLHNAPPPYLELLAKQKRKDADPRGHSRKYFRHEFASALAMMQEGDSDLAAYIVAAHHGRVRMSLRSMPGEIYENEGRRASARGIKERDSLLACQLGDGEQRPEIRLTLQGMLLGRDEQGSPSWTERTVRLRDTLGPFRLAYLEMLLRIADERASKEAGLRLAV